MTITNYTLTKLNTCWSFVITHIQKEMKHNLQHIAMRSVELRSPRNFFAGYSIEDFNIPKREKYKYILT